MGLHTIIDDLIGFNILLVFVYLLYLLYKKQKALSGKTTIFKPELAKKMFVVLVEHHMNAGVCTATKQPNLSDSAST